MTTLDNKRKELFYKSTHRGTKENDILLGDFAKVALASMDETSLVHYAAFLDVNDQLLFAWITGHEKPPSEYKNLVNAIRSVRK